LNLAGREVDAVALGDARFDFPDDLVDVDPVGARRVRGRARRLRPPLAVATPVVPAAPAMEVRPPVSVGMLVSCHL
jgi:hypothetical protein